MTPPHFYIFVIISPFKEDLALYLKKLEFPLPKDNLYQVWLKLARWFWRRRFLKFFSVFLLFRYYLPLEKGYPLPLNKLESPSSKDDLCQVWLKLVQWFWRRSRKCKSLQTDGQTNRRTDRHTPDNGRSEKLTFSSGELKRKRLSSKPRHRRIPLMNLMALLDVPKMPESDHKSVEFSKWRKSPLVYTIH
jgi:hypothetical protein